MNIFKKLFGLFQGKPLDEKEEIYAQDVMLHRIKCKFLYLSDTKREIEETFVSSSIDMLPLCRTNSDDIIGCYSIKSYLKDNLDGVEAFVSRQNIVFIPTKTTLKAVIDHIYNKKFGLLVVVDGYGGTQGIITEELLWQAIYKEIFGHESFVAIEGSFILTGETLFEDVEDLVAIKEFEPLKSLTLGGLIMEYLSRVPEIGEQFVIGSYSIKIIEANPTTIKKLSVTPLKK
jgi:putative hemolysin